MGYNTEVHTVNIMKLMSPDSVGTCSTVKSTQT